ncbi:MAG: peptide deformylase [Cyclobacteriaceae bacterium]|jgi:peptide deformylase|nr:peptide deformylase [Cyclobacteriaceae bacterium]
MIYPIVVYGDPVLRQRAKDIEKGSDISQLISDMHDTMQAAHGIGLAAPQIGKSVRLFVVDATTLEPEEGEEEEAEDLSDFKKAFINPQIIEESGEPWAFEEGCLSIPNLRENVARKETVRIKYYNENWELKEEVYDGMKARIIQHEYDHIEGKLFIDYLSPFKKRLLKGKLADISKGKVNTDYRIAVPK